MLHLTGEQVFAKRSNSCFQKSNGAVKLKQNKKNHDILVLIQEFEISRIKNAYARSVDNSSLIIMIIISVELFFVSVIIFYEI